MKERKEKFGLWVLMVFLWTILFGSLLSTSEEAIAAAVPDVKIAVAYPLSGALSRNGNLSVQGIKAAIGWVNDNGGIKSLGGAKLVSVIADTGSTLEGAASAMERVCRDPDIIMAVGSWASSLTLATTEVTQRLGIPHFSISFADSLSERGFKWGFYVCAPVSIHGEYGVGNVVRLAQSLGYPVKTAMIAGDNQAHLNLSHGCWVEYYYIWIHILYLLHNRGGISQGSHGPNLFS